MPPIAVAPKPRAVTLRPVRPSLPIARWSMVLLLRASAHWSGNGPVRAQAGDAVDAVIQDRGDLGALCLTRVEKPRPARLHRLIERARVTRPRLAGGLVVAAPAAVNEAEPDHGKQSVVEAQAEPAAIGD